MDKLPLHFLYTPIWYCDYNEADYDMFFEEFRKNITSACIPLVVYCEH